MNPNQAEKAPEPPANANGEGESHFFFIDPDLKDQRRQIRVHVMREHFRQKRVNVDKNQNHSPAVVKPTVSRWRLCSMTPKGQRNRASGDGSSTSRRSKYTSSSLSKQSKNANTVPQSSMQLGNLLNSQVARSSPAPAEFDAFAATATAVPAAASDAASRNSEPLPGPQSLLDGVSVDPFDSLPIHLNIREHGLVFHFLSVAPTVPSRPFYHHFSPDSPFNPYRHIIFRLALDGPMSFEVGVLAFASIHRLCLLEHENSTVEARQAAKTMAISKRQQAYALLQQLEDPALYTTTDAIFSLAAMASSENRFGDRQVSWNHLRTVMNMVRQRGGLETIRHKPDLEIFIHWIHFTMLGYQPPDFLPRFVSWRTLEQHTLESECDVFLTFLRNAESMRYAGTNTYCGLRSTWKCILFKCENAFHKLLSATPRFPIQVLARFAALIYFNVVLWDYRSTPNQLDRFFEMVSIKIVENRLDHIWEVQVFLFLVMRLEFELDIGRPERPWLVGELLDVAKRLSRSSWEKLDRFLLSCLTMDDDDTYLRLASSPLRQDDLRNEILSTPASANIAPIIRS